MEARMEHYACMVTLLGGTMPFEPDACVFGELCLVLVEFTRIFKLEPSNPGNTYFYQTFIASEGKWIEVDKVRNMMKSLGLRKNPGCSWIELRTRLRPNTDFVLQDVEEQDKEQILCGHSEKLAGVFGLLSTSPGSPLQVIQNLRICGDCHA
ncbi:pentatricopeptide repeat-containing protein, partial [Quercus suber]